MKWANHLDNANDSTANTTIEFLVATDIVPCFMVATIPIEATDMICSITSATLRLLYAELQLLQFTTWDQYLYKLICNEKFKDQGTQAFQKLFISI